MVVNRERKSVAEYVGAAELDGITLQELVDRATYLLERYGPDAVVDGHSAPYENNRHRVVFTNRLETDVEYDSRIAREERYTRDVEENERRTFERLKKKFEVNDAQRN
jgi:hypothetical protein